MADLVFTSPYGGVGDHQVEAQQRVYLKPLWYDRQEDEPTPWVLQPQLWAERVTWCAQPDMPSATLYWRYGLGLAPGQPDFVPYLKMQNMHRMMVKILIGPPDNQSAWYGTIETEQHQPWGKSVMLGNTPIESGEQVFTAYGLEMLLDNAVQMQTWFSKLRTDPTEQETLYSRMGITFNEENRGNRVNDRLDNPYLPYPFLLYPDSEFEDPPAKWTTSNIAEYLVWSAGQQLFLPFTMAEEVYNLLPFYDAPVVEQHGRTVRELLNQVISRQRMHCWWVDYDAIAAAEADEDTADQVPDIPVRVATLTEVNIQVGGPTEVIYANTSTHTLDLEASNDSVLGTQTSSVDACDVVRVYGAKRTATFSTSVFISPVGGPIERFPDDTRVRGRIPTAMGIEWDFQQQLPYEEGATHEAGYPPASEVFERRRRDQSARNRENVRKVFRTLGMQYFLDALAIKPHILVQPTEFIHLDPLGDNVDNPLESGGVRQLYPHLRLLPELPLRKGVDYSAFPATIPDEDATKEFEKPFGMIIKDLDPTAIADDTDFTYEMLDALGRKLPVKANEKEAIEFSVNMTVRDKTIELDVVGAPQHALAKDVWTPLPHDEEIPALGIYNIIFTLCVEINRHAMGQWPAALPGLPSTESERVLAIYMGDKYRKDLVARNTVFPTDLPNPMNVPPRGGGWIRDDEGQLEFFAHMAYQFYNRPRAAVSFHCIWQTPAAQLKVGDMILSYKQNGQDKPVNSVVTWKEITASRTNSQDGVPLAQPVQFALQTSFADLDLQRVILK